MKCINKYESYACISSKHSSNTAFKLFRKPNKVDMVGMKNE